MVIDPRYTPDAARADVVAGSPRHRRCHDAGLDARHIIDKKLYNEEFCSKWTNLPFLVDPSDPAGALLRASKVFADATAENEGYVYYDENRRGKQGRSLWARTTRFPITWRQFGPYDVTFLMTAPPSRRRLPSRPTRSNPTSSRSTTWPKCAWLMQAT